jgi:hypothetical protein
MTCSRPQPDTYFAEFNCCLNACDEAVVNHMAKNFFVRMTHYAVVLKYHKALSGNEFGVQILRNGGRGHLEWTERCAFWSR